MSESSLITLVNYDANSLIISLFLSNYLLKECLLHDNFLKNNFNLILISTQLTA